MILYKQEREFHHKYEFVAGVDEAGRGPLAGPLVVAAVVLDFRNQIDNLNDSKKLSATKRKKLYEIIVAQALAYHIVCIEPEIIDSLNILQATMYGMRSAVEGLYIKPDICLIDGNCMPANLPCPASAQVKGDAKFASIAAASILAKVHRDKIMDNLHYHYPDYGFLTNRGYPTREHLEAIKKFGITPVHRLSYKPVQEQVVDFS